MDYQPFCRTEVVFSDKEQLLVRLRSLRQNVVLIMSESAAIRWGLDTFVQSLADQAKDHGLTLVWIKSISGNPSQEDILSGLKQIGGQPVDTLIAIGGGSVMDLAKGISAFINDHTCRSNLDITESIRCRTYVHNTFVGLIAVPTTAGTGSEVTQWAAIWDKHVKAKYSLDALGLQPKAAIIVPELTVSVPALMTLSTGLDAMCQAIESHWSRHTNPLIQELAYRAVELIVKNLRKAVDDPLNLEAREYLCLASVLGGLAFSREGLPLVIRSLIP